MTKIYTFVFLILWIQTSRSAWREEDIVENNLEMRALLDEMSIPPKPADLTDLPNSIICEGVEYNNVNTQHPFYGNRDKDSQNYNWYIEGQTQMNENRSQILLNFSDGDQFHAILFKKIELQKLKSKPQIKNIKALDLSGYESLNGDPYLVEEIFCQPPQSKSH